MGDKTLEKTSDSMMTQECDLTIPKFQPGLTASTQSLHQTDELLGTTVQEEEDSDAWFASLQLLPRSCFCKLQFERMTANFIFSCKRRRKMAQTGT